MLPIQKKSASLDNHLVEDALRRDPPDITTALIHIQPYVRYIATGAEWRCLDKSLSADDLCQEALLAVIKSLPRWDPSKGNISTWITLVARRKIITVAGFGPLGLCHKYNFGKKGHKHVQSTRALTPIMPIGVSYDDCKTHGITYEDVVDKTVPPDSLITDIVDILEPNRRRIMQDHLAGFSLQENAARNNVNVKTVDNFLCRIREIAKNLLAGESPWINGKPTRRERMVYNQICDGTSAEEIATIMQTTPEAVTGLYNSALQKIRAVVGNGDFKSKSLSGAPLTDKEQHVYDMFTRGIHRLEICKQLSLTLGQLHCIQIKITEKMGIQVIPHVTLPRGRPKKSSQPV